MLLPLLLDFYQSSDGMCFLCCCVCFEYGGGCLLGGGVVLVCCFWYGSCGLLLFLVDDVWLVCGFCYCFF